jgi:hypothetical protein
MGVVNVVHSWTEILEGVKREQGQSRDLRVALYPCAPFLSLPHHPNSVRAHL